MVGRCEQDGGIFLCPILVVCYGDNIVAAEPRSYHNKWPLLARLAGHLPGLSPNYRHYAGTLPTATPANTFYSQHYYLDGEHFTLDDVTHCHHYYVYFRCSNVDNGSPHLNMAV